MFEFIYLLSQFIVNVLSITLIGLFICVALIIPNSINPIILKKLNIWQSIQVYLLAIFILLQYLTQVIVFSDEGLTGLFDPFYHQLILDSPKKWILISCYLSLFLITLIRFRSCKYTNILNIIFSSLLLSPFVLSGHFYGAHIIFTALILIHIVCVSFWIGSLYPLYLCSHPKLNNDILAVKQLMEKFGNIAIAFLISLVISGGTLFLYNTDNINFFLTSNYHIGFLIKFTTVATILCIACLHKFILVKNLNSQHSLATLNRSIFIEMIIGLIIILISTLVVKYIGLS